ncbi:MAG TPA: DNA polymerase ligase N-terminal domain-containing protein [Vicinamibacterales bacterium]|nr:DNA polymerase ligase N-terminal domain-containing protein [Vicinamibacterales bacterium]
MPLDEYRAKRDFRRSPEPAGDERLRRRRARARDRFFCVQKHLASHLHYDFRLEHDGVLLSWAVPKGPSLDPRDKRLAMRVEDHPLEYGTFEGVIPSGYGAGIVMLWDYGTWQPQTADVDEALRKGELKFTLDGFKLKGSWVLVRTRRPAPGGGARGADGRSWLLIKHRDEWSGALDITTFAPDSVKSGGDFADILAADDPDIWISSRPAQGGTTGRLLQEVIAKAAALRKHREETTATKGTAAAKRTTGRGSTRAAGDTAALAKRKSRTGTKSAATPTRTPGKTRRRGAAGTARRTAKAAGTVKAAGTTAEAQEGRPRSGGRRRP